MANLTIIQWNCRGFRANQNDLSLLSGKFKPVAFCLQELLLSDSYVYNDQSYTLLSNQPPLDINNRPHGGAGILLRKSIPHSAISLNTTLQAVACRISTPKPITLCSIYLPPPSKWSQADLASIILQLPAPILLFGDFNAQSQLMGLLQH